MRAVNADAVFADVAEGFFAVADAVGSTDESVRASAAAVREAHNAFLAARASATFADLDLSDLIIDAYARYAAALTSSVQHLPSSTLSIVLLNGLHLRYVNVGDSPIFWIDRDQVSLLTREHTMVDQGKVISNFNDLKSQNGSNILVNTFGRHAPRATLYQTVELLAPSRLLVCSDGLMDFLTQDELGALSAAAPTLEDLVAAIYGVAAQTKPSDNYSGVIIELPARSSL